MLSLRGLFFSERKQRENISEGEGKWYGSWEKQRKGTLW